MPIQKLPADVTSQIAAGEVIERPASVVKELLENSLDSASRSIEIYVDGAGKQRVELIDDGSGIPPNELPIAVERHATSKLRNAEDLFHIGTLGFRGEALASIGSVARLTITSRIPDLDYAARLVVEGGRLGPVKQVGAPQGTTVKVEELFYNVPARLKFLKSDITERHHIDSLVTRYALAYPMVRMQLHQDGKPILRTSGNNDRREILAAVYGIDLAKQMMEVYSETDGITITGFISPISLTRSNRREITVFVNGRPVQDVAITSAVVQAYHTMLMVGRYPMAILFIQIPPEDVDVNVHPAKAEVRFRTPSQVFSAVQNAVRRALLAHTPVPGVEMPGLWIGSQQKKYPSGTMGWETSRGISPQFTSQEYPEGSTSPRDAPGGSTQPGMPDIARAPILRLVGQIAAAYIIAEGPDGLYLIDQHAAHERVLFEQIIAQKQSSIAAQSLLQPATVHLSPASARILNEQIDSLNHLGFQVEPFGQGTFLVRAIPALLSGLDPAAAIKVLVEDFEEDETPLQSELDARIIARVCKRAAVKAGQTLSLEEQRSLLNRLENCVSPRTCPHGRPTMIHLSVDLLERQFGRKGPR
jgi:DNA mismatch repair protein MutL